MMQNPNMVPRPALTINRIETFRKLVAQGEEALLTWQFAPNESLDVYDSPTDILAITREIARS